MKIKLKKQVTEEFVNKLIEKNTMSTKTLTSETMEIFDVEQELFPKCIFENWQMNQSERIGLAGILHQHKPKLCIEIGTFCAGSLSLIAQYADEVYSIDIDGTIPERYKQLKNVTFITGDSKNVLPELFKKLRDEDKNVDFILVDGDHSKEGVRQDLNLILDYVPTKPLYLMMHDSFNPACRQGMREAEWGKAKYLSFADLDFIPGRIIEHGGGGHGELWGGLALAIFLPEKSKQPVSIQETAHLFFEHSKKFVP